MECSYVLVEMQTVQPLWKTVWQLLINLKILLSYDLTIPLLSIYFKEVKTSVHTKTYTNAYSSSIHNYQKLKT